MAFISLFYKSGWKWLSFGNIYNEKGLIVQNKKVKKLKKIKKKKILDSDENNSDIGNKFEKNNKKINRYKIWFKWNYNSCRYDSFSLIYGLIIKPTMEKENITPQNGVINYINELVDISLNLTEDKYEEGIWNIIKINKNNLYDLTNKENCFKKKVL